MFNSEITVEVIFLKNYIVASYTIISFMGNVTQSSMYFEVAWVFYASGFTGLFVCFNLAPAAIDLKTLERTFS